MTRPSVKEELSHKKANISNDNINPFIPLDVIEQIFHRADIKALIRCSFVCRGWNTLITSPDFIVRSLNPTLDSEKQMILLKTRQCENGTSEIVYYPFEPCPQAKVTYSVHCDDAQLNLLHVLESPPIRDFEGTHLIDVSNGLVCLKKPKFELILWNLSIRKYVCLPLPVIGEDRIFHHIGFGFDHINHDFKVVDIVINSGITPECKFLSAWIFSYATWSWKCLTCSVTPLFIKVRNTCVSLNGVLHWISWCKEDDTCKFFILTFDLTSEEFGQIHFPSSARHDCVNSIMTDGDSLLLIQERQVYDEDDEDWVTLNFFSVWIVKQHGNVSWKNIFSIASEINPEWILGVRKNGEIMLDMDDGEICRYNLTPPSIVPAKTMKNGVFFSYFTKSLFLLEKGKGVRFY